MSTMRALLMMMALAACGKADGGSTQGTASTTSTTTTTTTTTAQAGDPAAKAKDLFGTRCFACHGPEGRGNGPASATLDPKPRNFHDTAWQAKVTDDHIETIIKVGGAAVGLSPAMPSNPDLNNQPEVVAALKDYVRNLGKQP